MVPLLSSAMRAAAAAAGVRRAARCVRTAASRGDSARPSITVAESNSVARHERAPMALTCVRRPGEGVPKLDKLRQGLSSGHTLSKLVAVETVAPGISLPVSRAFGSV